MSLLWRPTLAATLPADYDLEALPYPLYASPKIDGVRAMIQNGRVVTRNGSEIRNEGVQRAFGRRTYEGLDGELCVGSPNAKDVFNATVRVVMSGSQEKEELAQDVLFCVFDCNRTPASGRILDFAGRYAFLRTAKWYSPSATVVEQTLIKSAQDLRVYEAKCLAQGYEGCMLRASTAGPYMQKRSTLKEFSLVKLKRMEYGEAIIIAVNPLEHNLNEERTSTGKRSTKKNGIVVDAERVGRADLMDVKSKVVFSVSIAGDVLQKHPIWRSSHWYKRRVRYKFQLCGTMNGVPRFPTCTFEELL